MFRFLTEKDPSGSVRRTAWRITLAYAAGAGIWILISDGLLALITVPPGEAIIGQMSKGLLFVAVTAVLLRWLVQTVLVNSGNLEFPEARNFISPPSRAGGPISVFVILVVATAVTALGVYQQQRNAIRIDRHNDLANIGRLKSIEISRWMEERRGDAQVLHADSHLAEHVDEWFKAGLPDDERRSDIHDRLDALLRNYDYHYVVVFDAAGIERMRVGTTAPWVVSDAQALLRLAAEQGGVVFSGLHRHPEVTDDERVEFNLAVPLLTGTNSASRRIGSLYLGADLYRHFYPIIRLWPSSSRTAETLLIRREGEDVVFLSALRKASLPPMSLRLPLTQADLSAVRAARGDEGVIEGNDYSGDPVLAFITKVPGTDWSLISKVDQSEIYAGIRRLAVFTALIAVGFIATGGAAVFMWWRRTQAVHQTTLYQAELERQALVQHFGTLSRYANDAIVLIDPQGRIVDANDRAGTMYGYERDKLIGMAVRDLRADAGAASFLTDWEMARRPEGLIFQTTHKRQDGGEISVEVSSRPIAIDGKSYQQSIIRDITERVEDERRLAHINTLYAVLSKTNSAIVRSADRASMLQDICDIAVQDGHFPLAWIGFVDPDSHEIRPAAAAGTMTGYLEGIRVSADPDLPEGRGPTGIAAREGRVFICSDIQLEPATVPWRERMIRFGIRSSCAIPLQCGASLTGALTVYATEPNFFQDSLVALLEEMAADVSYALEKIENEKRRHEAEQARARAVAEMEENRRLLQGLMDQSGSVIYLFDREGRILLANRRFEQVTGCSLKDVVGRTRHEIGLPKNIADQHRINDLRILRTGAPLLIEETNIEPDGDHYYISIKFPLFDTNGVIYAVGGISTDITERKHAEQSLYMEKERIKALLAFNEVAPSLPEGELLKLGVEEGVRLTNSQIGYFHLVNEDQRTIELVAWSSETLKYCTAAYDNHYPLDKAGVWGDCARLGRPFIHNDYQALANRRGYPDGHAHLIRHMNVPVMEEDKVFAIMGVGNKTAEYNDGDVRLLQLLAQDLWRLVMRHRTESALKSSEERLRAITHSVVDAIIAIDADHRILSWNKGAANIFGYSEAEAIGMPVTTIMPERLRDAHRQAVANLTATGTPRIIGRQVEVVGLRKNGQEFPIELTLGSWHEDGKHFFTGILRDITSRKETEAQVWQAQKQESLGNLAGGVAHDFNNMLLPIIALSELTMNELPPDSRGHRRLAKVLDAASRAKQLVQRILLFSRRETPERKVIYLADTIREARDFLRAALPTSMDIRYDIEHCDCKVLADARQIDAVLLNLGANAADALMGHPGTLDIAIIRPVVGEVDFSVLPSLDPKRQYAVLRVKDNGCGMSDEVQKRIFDPFFTTKSVGEGTGLGLAIVHGVVSQHEGAIRVHSRIGKGTTFEIYLPIVEDGTA